jgi:hypothetical protein
MTEIKQTLGEIHNSHVVFNKATTIGSTSIIQSIYGSLSETFSTWSSQVKSQGKIISQFLEKSFKYTSQEIDSLSDVQPQLLKIS